ncbi:unnamed protein product, partial [Iphiclides podalirius]
MDARVYHRIHALRQSGDSEPEEALKSIKWQERHTAFLVWCVWLTVMSAMLNGDVAWRAVTSFCETAMVKKEAAEMGRARTDPHRGRSHRGEGTLRYGP